MSLAIKAKTKVDTVNIKEVFKNEAGAIDLASIMVGIIVIGLIGGVIAATVFAVIPWAQDNAAKQQLDSVASAQSAYIGLSADKGNTRFAGSFVSSGTLPEGGFGYTYNTDSSSSAIGGDAISPEKLFNYSGNKLSIGRWGNGTTGAHYAAAIKSASGKTFYISDSKTQPTLEDIPANKGVLSTAEVEAVVDKVKDVP